MAKSLHTNFIYNIRIIGINMKNIKNGRSEKSFIVCVLLMVFLGGFHRIYVGKIGTGILFFLTFGGLGIWWLIDFISVLSGKFTDKNCQIVKNDVREFSSKEDKLLKLHELYEKKIITKQEYESRKDKLLKD